uniref:Cilia- and flagella-associated protein 91 n=1 Tax=Globisporangium ultimum (strain ATCC 200006 / CBS 805.95 / DAOM BR144) TaxID=431595 RepID=K3X4B1_GLOUD
MAMAAATKPAAKELVVLGGGISGLSLAYFLRRALQQQQAPPARIRVVDAAPHAGGWIRTAKRSEFLFEEGPRGFRPSRNGAEILRLVEELGLQRDMRTVDAAAKSRYVLRNGHVEKLPSNVREILTWPLTKELVKAGAHELFTKRSALPDESIYDFASRRFSPLVAERLLDPVASGIFGGDIRNLSVRSCFKMLYDLEQEHGSVVRGMLFGKSPADDTLLDGSTKSDFVRSHESSVSVSFQDGMSTLMNALEAQIQADPLSEIHLNTKVNAIQPHSTSTSSPPAFTIKLQDSTVTQPHEIEVSHVFSTLPAFQLASAVESSLPALAKTLQEIQFVSMGMVHVGFSDRVLDSDGFGYLVPTCERERVLGVVFDSNAFPSQNAASRSMQTRLSIMCGGAHFPEITDLGLDEVEKLARDAVKRHLGISKEPDYVRSMVLHNCIPQYHVGFWKTLETIESQLVPGMSLGGNSFYGVGLADCVTRSKELALEKKRLPPLACYKMAHLVPTRALDSVYDPVYTVSRSGGRFSKGVYRASGSKPPTAATSSNNNNNNSTAGYVMVSGAERPKFFRRPILPHLQAELPEVLLSPPVLATSTSSALKNRLNEEQHEMASTTRSVGIQTMYRDSDAQTDPYTPDYTIKKSQSATTAKEPPEVLSLLHLRHNQGLPAGQAEIELIERNRKKKAFDASLPPMTDEASFLLRKSMMEVQETREWAFREAEIDQLHAQRIALLQQALVERDKENEFLAEQRVEALRAKLVHEKENAIERIQQERVTALRKLTKKRQHGLLASPSKAKRDIIQEYTDFGSKVYAPVTRNGKSGKVDILEVGIGKQQYKQIESLIELEAAVPPRMLLSSKLKPPEKSVRTAKERKQAAIEAHLLKMESIIKKSKETIEDASPSSSHGSMSSPTPMRSRHSSLHQAQVMTRPPTPDYALPSDEDDSMADAVRLLQKLIRGRAVQNMMFEGKERRAELIQELRASDEAYKQDQLDKQLLDVVDDNKVASATLAKAEGEVISDMLDFLYKELDRSKEIAKMRAFVDNAAEARRRLEVEEGGRRQAEDLLRGREDEVFRCIERVHQETASDLILDIIGGVIQEQAHIAAMDELNVMTNGVSNIVMQLEETYNSDAVIVKELVASFLLPQVQRLNVRDQVAHEQQKYVTAAHSVLTKMVHQMKAAET